MPIIRDATEADLPAILAITNEAIANTTAIWRLLPATLTTRQAWMRDRQNRGFPVLVAEEGGIVLGFASYGDYRQGEGYQHTVEHSVYVSPHAQGQGLGKRLLAALIEHATICGMHVMIAGIDASNTASIELHRRAGFEEAGRQRQVGRKFDRWLDLQFMQKLLPGPEHVNQNASPI